MTSKNQAGAVAAVDNNTFDETVLKGQGVVLVDFWASWCEPCHKLAPLLRKLTLDYANDLTVFAFDVDGNGGLNEVGSRFDFDGIPALLFFKDGVEVERIIGSGPYAEMKSAFAEVLGSLGITAGDADNAKEEAYAAAALAASELFDAICGPLDEKLEAAMKPTDEEWQRKLDEAEAKLDAGELSQDDFTALEDQYKAAIMSIFEPFKAERRALHRTALTRYEADLEAALEQFAPAEPAVGEQAHTDADLHCEGGVCHL